LFKHLNKNVQDLVTNEISKDLMKFTERELLEFLKSNTQFVDSH
jgi:protein required for attachment to host cells